MYLLSKMQPLKSQTQNSMSCPHQVLQERIGLSTDVDGGAFPSMPNCSLVYIQGERELFSIAVSLLIRKDEGLDRVISMHYIHV